MQMVSTDGERNVCGNHIRSARKKAGLAQIDLAAALQLEHQLSLTQSDISDIENRNRVLRDYELQAIAAVLDVDVSSLIASRT